MKRQAKFGDECEDKAKEISGKIGEKPQGQGRGEIEV